MSPGIFLCFKIKWISLFYLSFSFSYVKMWDLLRKRKVKNHLFNSTLYDQHNAVQVCDSYGMTRYESFTHTAQPRIICRIFTSSAVRILNFIRHCFTYKMNDNTTRIVRRQIFSNFVNSVLLFYSQFSSNKLSVICGRRFSFITIASIDFWSDLQLIFWNFNACILPSIIRHTVVYAVWYGVWFLMVWPWFGHSSLNHNEHAVWHAVSRMKMPPVREHASSLWYQKPDVWTTEDTPPMYVWWVRRGINRTMQKNWNKYV